MGWFDEQIKQRKKNDEDLFSEAFVGIADAVLGSKMSAAFSTDEAKAQGAIEEILKYYHVKPREVPDSVKGLHDRLEYLLRPNGIMRRNVNLEKQEEPTSRELDDDELDAVAGGAATGDESGFCYCPLAGGGGGEDSNDGNVFGCACVIYGQGGDGRASDANCRCYVGGAGADNGKPYKWQN